MRLKASFTVENAVLVPLFTIIIITLVLYGISVHDHVIEHSAELQAAMKIEQESPGLSDQEQERVFQNAAAYISEKSMREDGDPYKVEQAAENKIIIRHNLPADFIRKVNAGSKLIMNDSEKE